MRNVMLLSATAIALAASSAPEDCRAEAEAAKLPADSAAATQPRGRPVVPLAGDWRVQFVAGAAQAPGERWETKPVKLPGVTRFPRSKEGVEQNGMTNPGDLVVAQQLEAPADPPAGIPPSEQLIPDNIEPGFSFYTEPMTAASDPYAYLPWWGLRGEDGGRRFLPSRRKPDGGRTPSPSCR